MANLKFAALPLNLVIALIAFAGLGCNKEESKRAVRAPVSVKMETVNLSPVPQLDEYVATIKSRRSASIQPQVDGLLTRILVKSGDHVRYGQALMTIDPLKQQAVVEQQNSTELQKKAVLDYASISLERQRKLYQEGVSAKQDLDLAEQAYQNAKADYDSSTAARVTQQRELAYYSLTAPFNGIVGDIPVHVGDYVAPQTLLTTVDENAELEAYIYIPTERSAEIHAGLPVQIVTSAGQLIESTKISFVSQQVDNATQGILVKAPLHGSLDEFRTAQLVKARVIWSTAPAPTVPVLAVTRIGGQAFVYVAEEAEKGAVARQRAVTLGDTVGNDYAVTGGLKAGEQVIISGTQLLTDGAPIQAVQ